jgi:hypothetical protein
MKRGAKSSGDERDRGEAELLRRVESVPDPVDEPAIADAFDALAELLLDRHQRIAAERAARLDAPPDRRKAA